MLALDIETDSDPFRSNRCNVSFKIIGHGKTMEVTPRLKLRRNHR